MHCPHPKSPRATRCRSCNCKAQWADPDFRARKNRISGQTLLRLKQDPAFRARESAAQRRNCAIMNATRRQLTPDELALAGKRQSARKLSWCPPVMRDAYRQLTRSKRIPAAQAREIILGQWKADIARRNSAQA